MSSALEGERAASGTPHADNVAPSLLGGLVLTEPGDPPHCTRLPVPDVRAAMLLRANTLAAGHSGVRRETLELLIDMLNRPPRRRGVAVVISDFMAPPDQWGRPLRKLAVEFPDGTVIFPTARVFRRLEQGAEQNVVEYYTMVGGEVKSEKEE